MATPGTQGTPTAAPSWDKAPVQKAALAVGAVFLLVGVLGFIPGITSHYDELAFAGHHSGAMLALIASCCWTFAPFLLASAVRGIGPYYANFWRLIMASGALWIIALIAITSVAANKASNAVPDATKRRTAS